MNSVFSRAFTPSLSLVRTLGLLSLNFFFLAPFAAQAVLYDPGETLDPACAPTDVDCGIEAQVGDGITGQVPYYSANGGVLTATSSITILTDGNVGVGTTTPYANLAIGGNLVLGASSAGGTLGDLYIPKLGTAAGTFLAVDAAGKVISTTTPAGSALTGTIGQLAYFSGTNAAVGTSTLFIAPSGKIGIGSTTPFANLSIHANNGSAGTNLFSIGSSTASATTTLFKIDNQGNLFATGTLSWFGGGPSNIFTQVNGNPTSNQIDHVFRTNALNTNVATFQSLANNGFSAIRFSDENGYEHAAVGYGNTGASSPFGSVVYLESSSETGLPPQIALIQSVIGTSNTVRLKVTENGETWIAAAPTTNVGNVFGIRANSTSYTSNATVNSSLVRLEQLGSATGLLVYTPNTFTNTDGAVRVHMAGVSSNAPALTLRQDGTGAWLGLQSGSNTNIFSILPNSGNPILSSTGNIILSPTNNVGVGTSSPWRTFSVSGTVALSGLTSSATGNALCITTSKDITDAGGASCVPSSIRFKEHVETLPQSFALDELNKLRVVSFDYKPGFYSTEDSPGSYGLIAEEVAEVDSKLVDYGYDGQPLTLKFEKLTGLAVQAIQELSKTVKGFAESITTLVLNAATGNFSEKICVGSTCLTESQLQKLLQDSGQQPSPQESAPQVPTPVQPTPEEPIVEEETETVDEEAQPAAPVGTEDAEEPADASTKQTTPVVE